MKTDARLTFADLLAPLTPAQFFDDIWEQRLLLQRCPRGRDFDDLFSLEAADQLIASTVLRPPSIELFRSGSYLPHPTFTTGTGPATVVDVARVFAEYHRGATILLRGVQRHSLSVGRFCRRLEEVFGCAVVCCAFLSPPNAAPEHGEPRFRPHYDVDDMLILQVSGRKEWLIYDEPEPLPMRDASREEVDATPGASSQQVTLRTGDVLYLPRGYIHDVVTSDEHSLHIRFTIHVIRWLDALRAGLESLSSDISFRRSLAVPTRNGHGPEAFAATFEQMKNLAFEKLSAADAVANLRQSFLEQHRPILDGHLLDCMRVNRVGLETIVARRPGVFGECSEDGRVLVRSRHKTLDERQLDPASARLILSRGVFRIADLPGPPDDVGKVALARQLIREGVLELTDRASDECHARHGSVQTDGR